MSEMQLGGQSETTAKISAAVVAVMLEVGSVAKGSKNAFHGYTYASDADLLFALQPEMAKNGLHWRPIWIRREHVEIGGKNKYITRIDAVYRLHHTSGEWLDFSMCGEGADAADKGAYKALTGTFKYLQRQAFSIPTGDDPEKDARKKKETPTAKTERQAGHHVSWTTKERRAFNAALSDRGWTYDELKAHLANLGKSSPSNWTGGNRLLILTRMDLDADDTDKFPYGPKGRQR